jgi:hypothetical protein
MKVKKLLLIGIPLLAVISAVAGLVMMGIIKVPFLKGKPKNPKPVAGAKKPTQTIKPKPPPMPETAKPALPAKQSSSAPTSDPAKGVKKVAKLWNEMEVAKLQELTTDWTEPDLARVLAQMETEKVAELLAALPPKRASALTRAIQREASRVPATPTAP